MKNVPNSLQVLALLLGGAIFSSVAFAEHAQIHLLNCSGKDKLNVDVYNGGDTLRYTPSSSTEYLSPNAPGGPSTYSVHCGHTQCYIYIQKKNNGKHHSSYHFMHGYVKDDKTHYYLCDAMEESEFNKSCTNMDNCCPSDLVSKYCTK